MKFSNSKRAINYLALLLVLFLSLNLNISCDTTEQQSKVKILLEVEDASCTEAWLNLKIESIVLPIEITLFQGDSLLFTTNINSSDTTLFVENLLPNQNYSFYSTIEQFNNGTIKSNSISVTTMDTTSHNFSWQTFTFGNRSSVLKDVAIINENDIWAVGEIHTAETDQFDSNGVWVKPYNAVHWDGVKWELKRIMFYSDPDKPEYGKDSSPCESAFVFNESEFAITSNVQTIIFDKAGNERIIKMGFPWKDRFTISSIWGTTSQDFYVVGNGGNIAHYNGNSWTKIESGTEEYLSDIFSVDDVIYVAGGDYMNSIGVLLKGNKTGFDVIKEGTYEYVDTVFNPYFVGSLSTLWLTPKGTLYFGGDALYKNKHNNWDFDRTLEGNCLRCNGGGKYYSSITKIRGNDGNDMVLVGLTNTVRHFNGVSWKQLGEAYDPNLSTLLWWYSVSMNNSEIIAVGEKGSQAIIRRFKR